MSLPGRPPSPIWAPLIEWRANRIDDPIERLRFLKSASERVSAPLLPVHRLKRIAWQASIPLLLWATLLVPMPGPSTVRDSGAVRAASLKTPAESSQAVWLVDQKPSFEIYSNGLRIEKEFATHNRSRAAFSVYKGSIAASDQTSDDNAPARTDPVGILFHSTESHQVPFEPAETRNLKRLGKYLIEYVRSRKSYHYVIDRFGRIYRVVEESDAANHAGRSVWANPAGAFVYLNDSFFGVAVESQSEVEPKMSTAQTHAVRVLTEMLRSKYKIAAADCVTHAQVSVNPSNHIIGYHTDWAVGFPFGAVGLPNNYAVPLASVYAFGFEYDGSFPHEGGRWPGLDESDRLLRDRAMAAGVPVAKYKRYLRHRFQNILNSASMRERGEEQ